MNEFSKHPATLKNILNDLIKRKQWQHKLELHEVFCFWEKAVGREIADQAKPWVIRGQVLWVNVRDSVWMQQLQFQKMVILEKLNRRLQEVKLTDIRFQLASRRQIPHLEETGEGAKAAATARPRRISGENVRELEEMLEEVKDEKIRSAILHLWQKYYQSEF